MVLRRGLPCQIPKNALKSLFTTRAALCYTEVSEKYELPTHWAGGKVEIPWI